MTKLTKIAASTLLSGGLVNNGSAFGYMTDQARRALGLARATLEDGTVQYFSKDKEILKRATLQAASQAAYGTLRSYPRYIKYIEQRDRDKKLKESNTSIANENGQYYRLIEDGKQIAKTKGYADSIVGNLVQDYLELKISGKKTESYKVKYDSSGNKIVSGNPNYVLTTEDLTFVDLQPLVHVSSRNNIILTQVQGRNASRKEFISGGDYEITINGKIVSKYPDVYPEAEVSKFIAMTQHIGVIDCDNTILRQYNISQLIILSHTLAPVEGCRNVQPYTLQAVAVEPSDAVEVKLAEEEFAEQALKENNQWIKAVKFGADVVDPASLLKITQKWL